MLTLTSDIQSDVWDQLDWSSSAPALGKSLVANKTLESSRKALLLRQIAELCEFCVLDPQSAADFYGASYQADRSQLDVLSRMRRLCHSMGRPDHAARTAELEFRHSQIPGFHAIAGQAWLDAGQPDRALKPLLRAIEESPDNLDVAAGLEIAKREWANPEEYANTLLEEAQQEGREAPRQALKAARIYRMLDLSDQRYEESLRLALLRDPNLESACHLKEHFLFADDRLEELADHFRRRAQSAPSHEAAALLLFEGSSLLFRAGEGDEGGPLFVEGLKLALDARLKSIPGLLAQLRGLVASGADHRKHVVELADQCYELLESADEQVGVAIFISQIACHAQNDKEKTKIWLKRLESHCNDHALLSDLDVG